MQAINVEGGKLVLSDAPEPECGPGEVRIAVAASAINRADLVQASGGYPPPPGASPILGLECSGTVIEVGEGVTRVSQGDAVCALLAGGGYAEQVVVPAGQVLPVPDGIDLIDAAALPEVFATAYLNLYMEARLSTRETVVVHAGASGVGTAAIQMLKQSNNPVFVTAGSPEKIARCVAMGADQGFDRHAGSFKDAVSQWQGDGVDVILDPVGAQYLEDNLSVLKLNGRLVLIGLMGGAAAQVNLGILMMKRVRLIGSTLRARPVAQKSQVMDGLLRDVWPAIERGDISPVVDARFALREAQLAHDLVATNDTFGKVLLAV
ncbi:MAG: NAD(P)H-quinone oxidoreductase [Pseudomonadota bacterium]